MPREFDNETYHINTPNSNNSFLPRSTIIIITAALLFIIIYSISTPLQADFGTKFPQEKSTQRITKLIDLTEKTEFSRFSKDELESLLYTYVKERNGVKPVVCEKPQPCETCPACPPPNPPQKCPKCETCPQCETCPACPPAQKHPKTSQVDSEPQLSTREVGINKDNSDNTNPLTPRPEIAPIPSNKPLLPPLYDGHEIIVTLTTIPDRMPYLNATLLSLVTQTVPPTEIVLNIPYVSRRFFNPDGSPLSYNLPPDFLDFVNLLGRLDEDSVRNDPIFPFEIPLLSRIPKITIHRCDDDGPATKLLPTLGREFSIGRLDSILMIADDDVIYPPNWVESLVGYYLSHPELKYSAVGAR